jgi:hypothetical protein
MDLDAELGEEMFVGGVLRLGFGDVDGLAIDEGEFAIGESGAYGAGDGVKHAAILAGSAAGDEPERKNGFAVRITSCGLGRSGATPVHEISAKVGADQRELW